ncbi:glycerophosphodiester phosphodiesterase family protein [Boudabousia marimammalium]|uniref:GP-PDE domain-containing protein n=1 Tax=Boudabousia marimammalium TaxID=156892 RepID=A0A1Q5PSB1_9ACTO|nr:glycerophosphodiester phosphodiesterase family protein [Boudabousia marimammalium]OKL50300.1 hypothetical protein BM477_02625 [Boudabousia marimammalium]
MSDQQKTNQIAINGRTLWLYAKYQLISKLLVTGLILPLFNMMMQALVHASGRTNISSGDYQGFLFSLYGLPVILVGAVMLIFIFAIDINTFIIVSSLVQERKFNMKMRNILWASLKSAKHFFSPIGVFLVIYTALVLPLIGLGISLGPFSQFQIPNFITSVIFKQPLYYAGYVAALVVLSLLAVIYIFTVHFILIDGRSELQALRSSRQLMRKHWKAFFPKYIWAIIKIALIFLSIAAILGAILAGLSYALSYSFMGVKGATALLLLSGVELFGFFAFVSVPILIGDLTKLFYQFNQQDGREIQLQINTQATALTGEELVQKIRFKTKAEVVGVLVLITAFNLTVATIMQTYFTEIFLTGKKIELVAHRGGGDLGAENTIQGIQKAIDQGVAWTEIDVQRTKDNQYIINHDKDFARVTGVAKKPGEMTLAEIKELQVKNEFYPDQPAQPVPTFTEILDASKGKIGVFVELKGESADEKMVDEVVALIKDKNMLDECVILSLDYKIIEYTALRHPEIKTGFLYFFSSGDLKDLKGDYLIMEEREATGENIDEIHAAGKKAVVWTVNTEESIQQFIRSSVDGIITDHPTAIRDALQQLDKRSPLEIVADFIIG